MTIKLFIDVNWTFVEQLKSTHSVRFVLVPLGRFFQFHPDGHMESF